MAIAGEVMCEMGLFAWTSPTDDRIGPFTFLSQTGAYQRLPLCRSHMRHPLPSERRTRAVHCASRG